jgi:MoxR-like ATPase
MKTIDDIIEILAEQKYIASREIAVTIFLALQLEKPVLIEGPAGVGKTDLAKCLAAGLSYPLVRLQCYEGLDESKALYEWEYSKQLLYTQILKERFNEIVSGEKTLAGAIEKLAKQESSLFSEKFIIARPILQVLKSEHKSVLLIDEIDKSDGEFEAFLLEVLSDFQISIPEIGTISAKTKPAVFLTSNSAREMSDALKRRCLHLYIDYPPQELEERIIELKAAECEASLRKQLVKAISRIRDLPLKKEPSISETIDWARALTLLGKDTIDKETLLSTIGVILKYEKDIELVKSRLNEIIYK